MSDEMYQQHQALKRFLNEYLYRHEQKLAMTRKVQIMIKELFSVYSEDVERMPAEFSDAAASHDKTGRARVVADYIAGMTDRYAMAAHESIQGC
jgi:dGTPase